MLKAKNGPKHFKPRKENFFWELSPETQKEILVIFLLAISVFCFLSFFGLAGNAGAYFTGSLKALFGLDYFLFPLLLILIVLVIIFPEYLAFKIRNIIGLAFFLLSLNGLLHLIFARHGILTEMESGGGYFGLLFSYPLLQWLRFPSALLTLSATLLVSFILAFNTSIKNILKPFALLILLTLRLFSRLFSPKPKFRSEFPQTPFDSAFAVKGVEKSAEEAKEPRNERAEERKNKILPKRVGIPLDLLVQKIDKPSAGDIKAHSEKISRTLLNFGIAVEMGPICVGPTVTQYTLKPAEGIKLSRITALSNDLALALAAHPIRIEAPIPGKSLVGIEVPNESIATVHIREILESQEFSAQGGSASGGKNKKSSLTIVLGKDVAGKAWVDDLGKMPHLLVAGATGSGKTVSLNSIIVSLLYQNSAEDLKLILIDPKRVELPVYNGIPHLFTPVVTEVSKTVNALKWTIGEMDRRFELLSQEGARDIDAYNRKIADPPFGEASKMPYLVIIIDELADLMIAAGSEVEACIIRLAQMARATGIHLIVATQRPSVDVITGLIKANITSRIAFAVASQTDSRTILDVAGAEKLLGRGDMLFITSELSKPKRLQGALVTDEEIKNVVDFIKTNSEKPTYDESITERHFGGHFAVGAMSLSDDDPLLPEAKDVIMRAGKASASLLQRRLKVGYARAARLLDLLEEQGIIGPPDGAKPREIFVSLPREMADLEGEEEQDNEEPLNT